MYPSQRLGRIAGLSYLFVAAFGGFALILRARFQVLGDGVTTVHRIAADPGLYRIGVVSDAVASVFWLLTAMAMYRLFRHVNADWARAMLAFTATGVAVALLNVAHQFTLVTVATDASSAGAFGDRGFAATARILLDLHHQGVLIAQIFFGLWLLPLGYLAYASRMVPRLLGILLMVGGVGWNADTVTQLLAPHLGAAVSPLFTAPSGLAEFATVLWLVVRGVRTAQRNGAALTAS